jgi:GST-like protein
VQPRRFGGRLLPGCRARRQLADNRFVAGDEYTIADMAIWPWYGNGMMNGASYDDPRKFLQTHEYKNLAR